MMNLRMPDAFSRICWRELRSLLRCRCTFYVSSGKAVKSFGPPPVHGSASWEMSIFSGFPARAPALLRCDTRPACATSAWYSSNGRRWRWLLLHSIANHLLAPRRSCKARGITGQHRTSGEHGTPRKLLHWTPPICYSRYPIGHGGGGDQIGWLALLRLDNFGGAAVHVRLIHLESSVFYGVWKWFKGCGIWDPVIFVFAISGIVRC